MKRWMWLLALAGCGVANDGDFAPLAEQVQAVVVLPLAAFEQAKLADRAHEAPGVRFITQANLDPQSGDWDCELDGSEETLVLGGRYVSKHLFAEGSLEQTPMPDVFKSYCVFEWIPNTANVLPDAAVVTDFRNDLEEAFSRVDEDLQNVAPQDQSMADASRSALSSYYRAFMGQLQPLPAPDSPLAKIRIAVTDTSPYSDDGSPNDGNSNHGLAMGRLAQVFSCPAGAQCPGFITHHLALPRQGAMDRPENGGFYGYQGEVARAIAEAVFLWETTDDDANGLPDERHLIINLSLGWEERTDELLTETPATFSMPNRAIYDALNYAACRGALIIAAAGNRTGGPDERKGPLFPAGYEARPAPSNATCQARFGVPATEAGLGATYRPLLYAVGGVRYDDRDLASRRENGRPRLVAGGFQVNVGIGETGLNSSTGVFTGSSSAAAAVSGMAAGLWAYRPTVDRHTLMQGIYDTGINLDPAPNGTPVRAEVCLGANCGSRSVRRVNMCNAWHTMCANGQGACPPPPHAFPCETYPAYAGSMAALEPAVPAMESVINFEARTVRDVEGSQLNATLAPPAQPSICKYEVGAMIHYRSNNSTGVAASPCLADQFYLGGSTPWAAPQPWGNLCPTCWAKKVTAPGGGTVVNVTMPTSTTYSAYEFFNTTLRFKSSTGWTLATVPLSSYGVTSYNGGVVLYAKDVPFPSLTATIEIEALTNTWFGTVTAYDEVAWW